MAIGKVDGRSLASLEGRSRPGDSNTTSYSLSTSDEALIRKRYTKPQIGLTAEERRANVSDAFLADSRIVRGKRFMLVDDVLTTGSTIASAAKALQMAGARTVAAFCLTTAQKRPEDYN